MTASSKTEAPAAPRFAAAASRSESLAPGAQPLTIPQDMLDGGEIVLLAIRPSLWFLLFDSARWVVLAAVLLAVAATASSPLGLSRQSVTQLACLMVAVRLGAALLRWVSRFYVLTNRRIMRFRGVFRADVLSCPLLKIRNTRVTHGFHERLTKLGTILFITEEMPDADLNWYQIARCDEVHSRVRRAIERAIDSQPHN